MHCCQTAMEIDLGKHSVIYLASVLTICSIDLPNLSTRHAFECNQSHACVLFCIGNTTGASYELLSQVLDTPACPVTSVVFWRRVRAINNRPATFGSNWLVNEQCQLKWSREVRSPQTTVEVCVLARAPLGCSGD